MPALHPTTTYNVEATINQWFLTKVATITLPFTLNYATVLLEPNTVATFPSFSLHHRGVNRLPAYQGNMAQDAMNIVMISAWVSRLNNPNWQAHLRVMRAMIEALAASPAVIRVSDYLTTPASPTPVDYVVRTGELEFLNLPHDENVDVERSSAVLSYDWNLRTNVT